MMSLENDPAIEMPRDLKPLSLSVLFFSLACERTFIITYITIKVDVTEGKRYCLQTRPCIFQTGNFVGCGSEGVNLKLSSSLACFHPV